MQACTNFAYKLCRVTKLRTIKLTRVTILSNEIIRK